MERFEVIEHTADFAINAYGKNYEELFANAAYGMFATMLGNIFEVDKKDTKKVERVSIKSSDRGELLIEFLNELLYRAETNHRAYGAFSFIILTNNELVALAYYSPLSRPKLEIKTATYHNLKIKKTRQGFEATVTFDV